MKTLLKNWLHKISAPIAGFRVPAHIILVLLLLWVVADGLFMDRSVEHLLVGHTALVFVILIGMILVEAAVYACRCLDCNTDCESGTPGTG